MSAGPRILEGEHVNVTGRFRYFPDLIFYGSRGLVVSWTHGLSAIEM
jgi:hypothetical protein